MGRMAPRGKHGDLWSPEEGEVMKTGKPWAGRGREVRGCGKALGVARGLLFLIYDFSHNYKSYPLSWTSSVCLQIPPHPSAPCSAPVTLIHFRGP